MGSMEIKNHSQKAKQDGTKPRKKPYESNIQSSVHDISRNRND